MKRLIALVCSFLLITWLTTGQGFADESTSTAQPTNLTAEDVFELLSATPEAVSADLTTANEPTEVLRAISTLEFHQVNPNAVDESLRETAHEWNRVVSAGLVVPSYEQLTYLYENNTEFQQEVNSLTTLASCTSTVMFIVFIAVFIWPFLIASIVHWCDSYLPSIPDWYDCTVDRTQVATGAVLSGVGSVLEDCTILTREFATKPA